MLFDNNDLMDYSLFNISDNNTNNLNVYSPQEGFLRGNMFKELYTPYKNLTYLNINPKSDREAFLYNVMEYSFAINDLNLYLDTHPNDKEALSYLEYLINEEDKYKKEYLNKYGPLDICDTEGNTYNWIENPWPWDGLGGNMYV